MRKLLALAIALPLAAGCVVHQNEAPSTVSGPAETGFSLKLQATPDSLLQDGTQTSSISVTAFGPDGTSVAKNVQLTLQGPGTLTPAAITTPGIAVYRPPAATSTSPTVVTILGKIIGTSGEVSSFGPLVAPQISVTLRPPTSAPPATSEIPTAIIASVTPTNPTTGATVLFNGATSCPSSAISGGGCAGATSTVTNWDWDFGDGTAHGTGAAPAHIFMAPRPYAVTLIVTNSQGNTSAPVTTVVTVAVPDTVNPAAAFVASPYTVAVNNTVSFDASASTPSTGASIVNYTWNFGDGTITSSQSPTTSHAYVAAGNKSVTVTVTDSRGRTSTSAAQTIVVQ